MPNLHPAYKLPARQDGIPRLSAKDVTWDCDSLHPEGVVRAGAPWCEWNAEMNMWLIPSRVALVCTAGDTVLEEVVLSTWWGKTYVGKDSMDHPYKIEVKTK